MYFGQLPYAWSTSRKMPSGQDHAVAVEAHALPRRRVEDQEPQVGPRLEVVGEGIGRRGLRRDAEQLRVDGLDEARRTP